MSDPNSVRAPISGSREPSPDGPGPSGFDPGRGLYAYAVMVSRHGPSPGQFATSMVQGYRIANNEDEVRGMAVAYTVGAKPDFSIDQVLVLRVGDDAVAQAHAIAMEARQGGDHEDERHAKHDSAGPQDIAQPTPPSSNEGKVS